MNAGRPSSFTNEIAKAICDGLMEGKSLRSLCEKDDMPSQSTVFRWLEDNEAFREQYARARAVQADTLFDQIIDIADDGTNDYKAKAGADGQTTTALDSEHIQRSRLRVDARKWMAGKLAPKKYGDKLDVEHAGKVAVVLTSADADL